MEAGQKGVLLWEDKEALSKVERFQLEGYVGNNFFRKHNLFLDFKQKRVVLTNDFKRLKKEGFTHFAKVPFTLTEKLIVFEAETELGKIRLGLDTGATVTLCRTSYLQGHETHKTQYGLPVFKAERFALGGIDFGAQELYFFPLTDKITEIEGVLGMDFLLERRVYLDFRKKMAYIESTPDPRLEHAE